MSLHEFTQHIQSAAAAGQTLRVRGGGSKDFYGTALNGEVLDTQGYSGIVSYEPSELVITARCGTPLAELEAALAEKGQCLAFEPPRFKSLGGLTGGTASGTVGGTVGGMVAAGLAGPARATQGGVRDYVLGLELINGSGELLRFGGTVMKNVAGYDVSRVLAGSMGTLGLITEVSLKVLPVAPAEATLKFTMDQATMLRTLNGWAGQPLPINASSWLVEDGVPTLYLRLRGALAAVQSACERLTQDLGAAFAPKVLDAPNAPNAPAAHIRADWAAARDLALPWFADFSPPATDLDPSRPGRPSQPTRTSPTERALWRISVPATAPAVPDHLAPDLYIDWLGAQRWAWLAAHDAEPRAEITTASTATTASASALRAWAQAQGGHATLFYVADPALKTQVFTPQSTVLQHINARLRAELDPRGVFDTGRI